MLFRSHGAAAPTKPTAAQVPISAQVPVSDPAPQRTAAAAPPSAGETLPPIIRPQSPRLVPPPVEIGAPVPVDAAPVDAAPVGAATTPGDRPTIIPLALPNRYRRSNPAGAPTPRPPTGAIPLDTPGLGGGAAADPAPFPTTPAVLTSDVWTDASIPYLR